jgi:hypothetical protein
MIEIDNISYKSQKSLKNKITSVIQKLNVSNNTECVIKPDSEYFNFWRDLFKRHPTKSHFEPTSFVIKNNWSKYHMYFKVNDYIDSFSYNTCVSKKLKSKNSDYFDCLRSSIEDQISDFRKSRSACTAQSACSVCNISDCTVKYEIDHVIPFKDLYENFKQTVEGLDQEDIKMYSNQEKHRTMFDLTDEYTKSLNDCWVEYHRENCLLQVLCKKCHILKTNKQIYTTI